MTNSPRHRTLTTLAAVLALTVAACSTSTSAPSTTTIPTAPPLGTSHTNPPETTGPDPSSTTAQSSAAATKSTTPSLRITQDQVSRFVSGWVSAHHGMAATAGISVAVSTPTTTLLAAGGHAGTTDRPLTSDTWMRMGSVTKTYVATALLRLEAAGRIDLDAAVSTFLPSSPVPTGTTVRQLLAMTAGLPDYLANPAWRTGLAQNPARRWTLADVMTLVPNTPRTPGPYSYCNSCYIVAGQILEQVTGVDYRTALHDLVLDPLGLRNTDTTGTGHHPADGTIIIADGVAPLPTKTLPSYNAFETTAGTAGCMVATAADVARFGRSLLDGQALAAKQWDEMRHYDTKGHYGLGYADFGGITAGEAITLPAFGNYGEISGFTTALLVFPANGVVISVMTNHDDLSGLLVATDLGRSLGLVPPASK
jgi:D-alanyl-D-alanine carboxypeptidase